MYADPEYLGIGDFAGLRVVTTTAECPDAAGMVFHNFGWKNLSLLKSIEARVGAVGAAYVYHEPLPRIIDLCREGLTQGAKNLAASILSWPLIKRADALVFASQYARSVYNHGAERRLNAKTCVIPLLFEDEVVDIRCFSDRQYALSYIGGIGPAHNISAFLRLAKQIRAADCTRRFCIATKSRLDLRDADRRVLRELEELGCIDIRAGRNMTTNEINSALMDSQSVWCFYIRSTQSGVLPKAFMCGTPVIASLKGSFREFVRTHANGELVSAEDQLYASWCRIQKFGESYSQEARKSFVRTFSYTAQLGQLANLLGTIGGM